MIVDTYRTVAAEDVKVGDFFHSLGRGFIGREVTAVEPSVETVNGVRTIVRCGTSSVPFTAHLLPGMNVTVSAGTYGRTEV